MSSVSPCVLCGAAHRLFYCDTFKSLKPVQRLKVVKDNKLCENCLLSNHEVSTCRKPSVCSVPNCGKKHTRFIHIDEVTNVIQNVDMSDQSVNVLQDSSGDISANSANCMIANQLPKSKYSVVLSASSNRS